LKMAQTTAVIPPQARSKHLRACLLCSIVQTSNDFRKSGCPNCEELMGMKGSGDRTEVCTSAHFDGIIAVIDPEASWVARWQRTSKYVRGMYAVRVRGRIPYDLEAELESRGIKYRSRDQTDQD